MSYNSPVRGTICLSLDNITVPYIALLCATADCKTMHHAMTNHIANPPTPLWQWRRAYWGANSHTKCSVTFVNIAVAISALAGGALSRFRTESKSCWCFRIFSTIFWCLSFRTHGNGILGHFGKILMEFWVILVDFRQWKNGQKWKNIANSDILKGVWMPEHWKHCKN